MAEPGGRLGRGLAALLGDAPTGPSAATGLLELSLDAIEPNPDQPRRGIEAAALEALSSSIAASGLVQPVVVRPVSDGRYQLIAGERRWRAAAAAGLASIPALVRDADERERLELGLVENLVREDLNPMEVARAVAILVEDFGQTHAQLAGRIGRSRPAISNLLRLLELPDDVQALVSDGALTEGHARAVLMADGAAARRRVAEAAVARGLSVRATEDLARRSAAGPTTRDHRELPPIADDAIDAFHGAFEVPVRVRGTGDGRFVVELRFDEASDLAQAVDRLRSLRTP